MNHGLWVRVGQAVIFAIALLSQALPAPAKETFTATIVVARGLSEPLKTPLSVTIDQYTTDAEARQVRQVLDKSGWDELVKALRQTNKGSARMKDGPTWPINWARVFPGATGSRRIMMFAARPIPLPEEGAQAPSVDPAFGVIQLDLNAQGKGEGLLIGGAKIRVSKEGNLEIEANNTSPRRLIEVQLVP